MSSPRRPDPDLDPILDKDPGLERYARLLGAARLKSPPLDPGFRHALRRELMSQAYDRYDRARRPGLLARLFNGPRMAFATVAVGALLVAFLLVANGNLLGSGTVTVTARNTGVNEPILVSFSQPMDHQSVEQSIQIQPATQVTYAWQGNNLVITPTSGQLAPNTQYHVTVTAAARTAPGTSIGHPATVTVTTSPLPSPSPSPAPSPTPTPEPQITSEQVLSGTSGTVVGFSADGRSLFFLTPGGDLDVIGVDGAGRRTIHSGVSAASVGPNDTALAFSVGGPDGGVYLGGPDGENPQLVDKRREAQVIGWLEGKPFLMAGVDLGPAGASPLARLPQPASQAALSPDGKSIVGVTASGAAGASPGPPSAFLFTLTSQTLVTWTTAGSDFSWSPDSSRVAFWSNGQLLAANPDGSSVVTLAKAKEPIEAQWTDDGSRLLFGAADGAWMVGADGSDLRQLSHNAFGHPAWAPGNGGFAYLRNGSIWVDGVSTANGSGLDLNAAASVVDSYEKAKLAGDQGSAAGLLGPSASPVPASPLPDALKLARYFAISSQLTSDGALFTVRLVYSHAGDEVRYQDEVVLVVSTSAGLRIGSVADGPLQVLGRGPTVNSVTVSSGQLVVRFDSDLDPKTVGPAVTVTGSDGQPVSVSTAYDHRTLTVTLHLAAGQKYTLAISSALKDIDGQPLQGGYQYQFVAPAGEGD